MDDSGLGLRLQGLTGFGFLDSRVQGEEGMGLRALVAGYRVQSSGLQVQRHRPGSISY